MKKLKDIYILNKCKVVMIVSIAFWPKVITLSLIFLEEVYTSQSMCELDVTPQEATSESDEQPKK